MNSRKSTTCVLSSQSSWSPYAATIIGSSSGSSGSDLSQLDSPIPIYYDQSHRRIIVGDHGNQRVLQFSLDNTSLNGTVIAGGNGGGCNLNQFWTIVGVTIDSFGQLYVADAGCYQILRFPPNSNSSTFAVLLSSLNIPQGISMNPLTDDLYVSVFGDNSVVKFTKNSTNGVVVAGGNGGGNGLDQVSTPNNVYFDYLYTNSLYVADSGNNRILRFPANSTSATYGTIAAGDGSDGNNSSQLSNPRAMVVDMNGILYISDGHNKRIQRWLPNASSGDTIAGGTQGTAANQFGWTESIFFDESFNLFVVDRGNSRIQLFNITVC